MASITLVCPVCQASYPVEAGLQDVASRQALLAAAHLWPVELQPGLLTYLGLFRPPQRALAWPKLARLLTELVELLRVGTVTRHRDTRPASLAQWAAGVTEILKLRDAGTLTLPLTGHGLLCEIVFRAAGQAQQRQAAADRPLHPSHRVLPPSPPAGEGLGERGPSPRDSPTRQTGLHQVGALAQALKGRLAAPQPTLNPGLTAPTTSDHDHE